MMTRLIHRNRIGRREVLEPIKVEKAVFPTVRGGGGGARGGTPKSPRRDGTAICSPSGAA